MAEFPALPSPSEGDCCRGFDRTIVGRGLFGDFLNFTLTGVKSLSIEAHRGVGSGKVLKASDNISRYISIQHIAETFLEALDGPAQQGPLLCRCLRRRWCHVVGVSLGRSCGPGGVEVEMAKGREFT